MATAFVFGLPGVPYITVNQHFDIGDEVDFEGVKFLVDKADEVTRENQGQNVYLKQAGRG